MKIHEVAIVMLVGLLIALGAVLFLCKTAKAEVVECSVEYTNNFYYLISLDTDKDQFSISAPHMSWRGPASVYSNPEGETYYLQMGGKYLTFKRQTKLVSFEGEAGPFKECR